MLEKVTWEMCGKLMLEKVPGELCENCGESDRKSAVSSASKEAGLAQEIRGTSFEHLLLHATSVDYGHWASTTSATALGVHSPSVTPLISFLPSGMSSDKVRKERHR